MLNLFSLHGQYFRDDENRLTANLLFLLSESRGALLPTFLRRVGVDPSHMDLSRMRVRFQARLDSPEQTDIPDAECRLEDDVHLLLEAKIGTNPLRVSQLQAYAQRLRVSPARRKRLVCITQVDERMSASAVVAEIEPVIVPVGTVVLLRWYEVLDLIRKTLGLTEQRELASDRAVLRGRPLNYADRLATLFLREVRGAMYEKRQIAEIPSGELDDVVITTQEHWYMEMARRHRVWFPSGATKYGLRPTKYVAYYEVSDGMNAHPKSISHVARNLTMWNRLTMDEARIEPELRGLFADAQAWNRMSKWDHLFHIVLTEAPVKLRRPIRLKANYARVLSKRRYSLPDVLNAESIDDLFGAGDTVPEQLSRSTVSS